MRPIVRAFFRAVNCDHGFWTPIHGARHRDGQPGALDMGAQTAVAGRVQATSETGVAARIGAQRRLNFTAPERFGWQIRVDRGKSRQIVRDSLAPRGLAVVVSGCPALVFGDFGVGLRSRRFQSNPVGDTWPRLSATSGTPNVSARRITIFATQLPPTSRLAATARPLAVPPRPATRHCRSRQIAAKSGILSRTTQAITAPQITKRAPW